MKSIKSKILVSMLAVALVGSILIGGIAAVTEVQSTYEVLETTIVPIAQVASRTIEEKLDNYWSTLTEAAALDVYHTSGPSDAALIERSAGIASRNGFIEIGKLDERGVGAGSRDESGQAYFEACKQTLAPAISDIIYEGDRQAFIMASPILTDGKFDGLVYGKVDAAFLTEVVRSMNIGESGYAYILDAHGNVIAYPDASYVSNGVNMIEQAKNDRSLTKLASLHERMLQGESGFDTYRYNGDGKLFGYVPISGEQGWSIGVSVSEAEFMAPLRNSIIVMGLIVLIVIVAGVLIAVRLARSVANPIKACMERLDLLSTGDLHTPVPQIHSKDETAGLMNGLNATVTRLADVVRDVSTHLDEMAQGNFTMEMTRQYQGDFVAIQQSMKQINDSINNTLSQISMAVDQVASGSDQVAASAQSLSQGATEQASSVQELAATIADISHHVQQNADNANSANENAQRVGNDMRQSNVKMQDLVAAMSEINSTSDEISKIIKTIEDIAFQTNILALNAAVEAARAGAAGKGFAVVADEVRNLAGKSADASKSTAALIERSLEAVHNGMNLVDETAASLVRTVEGAGNVVQMLDRIAEASRQQSESIEQVSLGIDQISSVVQTNSATSEQSAAASEELSSQAGLVRSLVGQFRLRGAAAQAPLDEPAEEPDSLIFTDSKY
ncbi:methyl-accepting chemotaxis protein [Anaerotruncus colihominis]|uniref:methyl-accepting chemotaxis protein n=2 Tax=Anaerotruncus colihominis TaxID=169435 RepID=UPI0018992F2F|nr:methyl-accepting chemotaxis protein [Anaerotruncus colihominis]